MSLKSFSAVIMSIAAFLVYSPAAAETSLNIMLKPYLAKYGLPALAAAVVKNGNTVASGASGVRRSGEDVVVRTGDRFHIGSDTKAFTALLAGILVEQGNLKWTTTVADVFPELKDRMDPRLRRATLEQLLSHTSGIAPDNEEFTRLLGRSYEQQDGGNLDELRYWLVKAWAGQPPASEPGAKFAYSNMGYTLAGAMIERRAAMTWEELMFKKIFQPLGLRSAGLGPQSSLGKTDAAVGHKIVKGKPKPMLAGPYGDIPPVIGPAGIAHMSVLDFAKWAGWNAGEGKRGPHIVKPETLKKLHTPVVSMPAKKSAPGTPSQGRYGLGWGEVHPNWSPHPVLYHGGSNGMNLAKIWVDPKEDFAIVIMTNIGTEKADEGLEVLASALYSRFGKSHATGEGPGSGPASPDSPNAQK